MRRRFDWISGLPRPRLSWQAGAVIVAAFAVGIFAVGLNSVIENAGQRVEIQRDTQEDYSRAIDELLRRVSALEDENKALAAEREKAKVQANTSVDQLVKSGERPIIAAPDVVTVPTTPNPTTSTTLPPVVMVPPTTTTTTTTTIEVPPTTVPPETTTTTTMITTTTTMAPPPETTTTTTLPETTTTVAPETTTTTGG